MARKAYNLEMAMEKPEEVEELYISGLNLKRVPKEVLKFRNLKKLDLSSNKIAKLPRELNNFIQLTELQLSGNLINDSSFSQFDISKLVNLRSLSFGGNALTKIPAGVFNLTKLDILNMMNNQLREIPPEILMLDKLRWLYLRNNSINALPEEFGELHNLRSLDLLGNKLKSLPSTFGKLQNLAQLELYENPIKKLPANFGELSSLKMLQFIITKAFDSSLLHQQLKNIKILYLSGDGYSKVPEQIFQLTNLDNLRISSFSSSILPVDIGNLVKLRSFGIEQIPLKSIPQSIGEMLNLENLDISGTKIKSLPSSILQLKKLRNFNAEKRLKPTLIMRFLKKLKEHKLPISLHEVAYDYLFLHKSRLKFLSKFDLFTLLNFPFQQLENNVRNHILNHHNLGLKNTPLKPETYLAILGKTNLNFKKIKPHLKNISKKITPQTTHVVLGKLPGEIENLASRDFVFVRESDLNLWVQQQENPYLLSSSEAEVDNLSRLLLSFQEENIEIVLQILGTGGVPTILLTDLVIVFKKLKTGRQKRAIRKLLSLHLSEADLRVVSLKTGLLKAEDLEKKILELTDETVLNGLKISKYLTAAKK